jgi:hypothetical protein
MDVFTMQQLKQLSQDKQGWCLSLFMPTHRAGPEVEQDHIRFKNLLTKAEEQLAEMGWKVREVTAFLKPAAELLQVYDFWQNQSDGLALFLTSEEFFKFQIPIQFREFMLVSKRFHLKPLLPIVMQDLDFKILALSQGEVKLFGCTSYTIEELDLSAKIPNFDETMKFDNFIKQVQFHTGTTRTRSGERAGMYFGHDPKDDEKQYLLNWLHKITDALSGYLRNDQAPIILAGVQYLLSMFIQANHTLPLVHEGIVGNPEEKNPQQLHQSGLSILNKKMLDEIEAEKNRYFNLSAKEMTTSLIDTIVSSAYHGRVDVMFYTPEFHLWGKYDPEGGIVEKHEHYQAGDEDLIDNAAVTTLLRGGKVYQLPVEDMPDQQQLAVILRY